MASRKIAQARAVVTGASSGIGREIALQLARQGAHVLVTARRQERLDELVEQIRSEGNHAHYVSGDLCDTLLRNDLLQAAEEHLGGLDILVNNAGVGAIGPFNQASPDSLRQIMEVNFFAPVELIRAALPLLKSALLKSGNSPIIVNIGSVLGHRAVPKKSEYCASKFAIHGFSDALRCELAPQGIDLLLVSPSTTESEFFENVLPDNALQDDANLPRRGWSTMSAHCVAKKTIRAIRRGRHEIILSPGGKLLVWCDRLMPALINRMIARLG